MASKRTKNRAYWVAVKSIAYPEKLPINYGQALVTYCNATFHGYPDSWVLNTIEHCEKHLGKASLKDVSNSDLWTARDQVESLTSDNEPFNPENHLAGRAIHLADIQPI